MNIIGFVSQTYTYGQRRHQTSLPAKLGRCSQRRPPDCLRLPKRWLRAHLPSPDPDSLLADLGSGSQPRQLVALIRLSSIPPNEALALLQKTEVLQSANLQVRLTALATLGKLGNREQAGVLLEALESDRDHSIRAAAASALGNLLHPTEGEGAIQGYEKVLTALIRAAEEDEHFIVRYAALIALGELANPVAVNTVLPVVRNFAAPALEATAAVAAIGKMVDLEGPTTEVLEAVAARAADRDELIRAAVVRTLGRWKNVDSVPELLQQMQGNEKRFGQSTHVQAILDDVLGDGRV
ncbi:unnamed protein product [Agarophyton chilense]